MSRAPKQFLYGVLFLGAIALLAGGRYVFFGRGGERVPVAPPEATAEPLRTFDSSFFFVGDRVLVAGEVMNPNAEFGARFSYVFSVYGNEGKVLRSFRGEETLGPRETHFLHDYVPDVLPVDVARATLQADEVTWLPADEFPAVRVTEIVPARLEEGADELRVSGRLRNESTLPSTGIRLVVFFKDATGFTRAITGARLAAFRPFEERDYLVRLPAPEIFMRLVRGGAIRLEIYRQ